MAPVRLSRPSRLVPALALLGAGCVSPGAPGELEEASGQLQGENLAGVNLAGVNLAGVNLAGVNLSGANLGGTNLSGTNLSGTNLSGTNLGGNNLGGNNLSGTNLSGTNLAGTNLSGVNLSGVNLSGTNLSGSNLSGTNLAGNNISGTNLSGTNLSGTNSGANIHNLGGSASMLYSREDSWTPKTGQCIVMGIGSTAFGKLLGQQSANAKINVALGKLPWGFATSSGGAKTLNAWEAIVWGDRTYCVFVLAAEPAVTYPGVQGFIKAIFRWNAPTTQSMDISGIEAARSAPVNDVTTATAIATYAGMMNTAAKYRAGSIDAVAFMAGELAFASATTNNQSVQVDFSSWVRDKNLDPIVLGNITSTNPPTYAEAVYIALDVGNGQVKVVLDDAAARTKQMPKVNGVPMVNSVWDLDRAYKAYKAGKAPRPIPRRCAGSLFLAKHYGEAVPNSQCDAGLEWAFGFCTQGGSQWSAVSGTTGPMNSYMTLANKNMPYRRTIELDHNNCGGSLLHVLSETYVHLWEPSYDLSGSCAAESNTTFCTRQEAACGTVTAMDNCGTARTVSCGGACPPATSTTYEAEQFSTTISGSAYALVCNKSASADEEYQAAGCTRGEVIRNIGYTSQNYAVINGITVPSTGAYAVTMWAVTGPDVAGAPQTRTMYLSVNGGAAITSNVSSPDWFNPVARTINVSLNAGANSIKFYNPNAGVWAPDLDRIEVGAGGGSGGSGSSNLYTNPSFASGTTGWTTYFSQSGSLASDSTAQDGDGKSGKVTIGSYSATAWDNHQVFQIKTANGSPYTVSAYFQKTEGSSKSATVYCSENGGSYTLWGTKACTNSSGWTQCQVTCTPPNGKSVKFGIGVGSSNVDVRLDNMSLTQ